jgi:hypothetical protein
MSSFFELFLEHAKRPLPEIDPAWADRQFESIAAATPLRLWRPGDSIPSNGCRLLLGVAAWSGYDMRLLDVIVDAIASRRPSSVPVVDVFNVAQCRQQLDFRQYIPKIRLVTQTPVAGLWREGRLVEIKQGYEARDFGARFFGADSAAIVEYVQDRIKARSAI